MKSELLSEENLTASSIPSQLIPFLNLADSLKAPFSTIAISELGIIFDALVESVPSNFQYPLIKELSYKKILFSIFRLSYSRILERLSLSKSSSESTTRGSKPYLTSQPSNIPSPSESGLWGSVPAKYSIALVKRSFSESGNPELSKSKPSSSES